MIPVAKPILSSEELDEIRAVLESGILAQGETVARFEERFAGTSAPITEWPSATAPPASTPPSPPWA